MRLNKYLAQCGVCSRRDADKLIEQGKVLVNGQVAGMGQQVEETDTVQVGKKILQGKQTQKVLAFYKPVGVTCTERDPHAEKKIMDMIRYPERLTYAGRLDKDSEGLILLTNDGDLGRQSLFHGQGFVCCPLLFHECIHVCCGGSQSLCCNLCNVSLELSVLCNARSMHR